MNRERGLWLTALILLPGLLLFGPVLFRDRIFAFRDATHFYFPLFAWINDTWEAGEIPLWNPLEGTGVPTSADASSSVFYPGKLLFALPLSFETKYKWYIFGHVLLAAAGAYVVARRWGASCEGAALAAIAYAYGGNVTFQFCNVIFLVGAAWMPFALYSAERLLVTKQWKWAGWYGVTLALMTLGGDPQATYHALLLSAGYALWLSFRRGKRVLRSFIGRCRAAAVSLARHAWLLGAAALLALLLSAVQVVPSNEWASKSIRANLSVPLNIWQALRLSQDPAPPITEIPPLENGNARSLSAAIETWPEFVAARSSSTELIQRGLVDEPAAGSHHGHIYEFSVGPWRWSEFFWPNISGRLFPIDRRWIGQFSSDERVWTPTLYMGLLPVIAAVVACRFRRGPRRVRWLTAIVVWGLLGALGTFGIGALIHNVRSWLGLPPLEHLGSPVGGLYWWMVVLLPTYGYFRFPAKLLTVAALAISLLAARGFDQMLNRFSRRLRAGFLAFGIASFLGALVTTFIWPQWEHWAEHMSFATLWLGPLDTDGAKIDIISAFLQTGVLCVLIQWLLSLEREPLVVAHSPTSDKLLVSLLKSRRPLLLVALTVAELSFANRWLIPSAPAQIVRDLPAILQPVADRELGNRGSIEANGPSEKWFRDYRFYYSAGMVGYTPEIWWEKWSLTRPADTSALEHSLLFPKHHLRWGVTSVDSASTLAPADYSILLATGRRLRPDGFRDLHPLILDLLAVRYMTMASDQLPNNVEKMPWETTAAEFEKVAVTRNPFAFPRAWIVHQVETMPELHNTQSKAVLQRTVDVLFPNATPRNFLQTAVVESDLKNEALRELPLINDSAAANERSVGSKANTSPEHCRIVVNKSRRVEIETTLTTPGLLVLSDYYYPGWRATVSTAGQPTVRPAGILRTNRIMRGVQLPAGVHRIVFEFQPMSFYAGATVSVITWCMLAILVFLHTRRILSLSRPVS